MLFGVLTIATDVFYFIGLYSNEKYARAHYNLLVKNTPIILSSENIGNYEPEIESVNIVVMTPQEIVDKAEDTGNFLHLKFKKISASGSSGIIELDNTWVSGVYDGVGYTSGGGFTLYIYKLDDGWGYEITSGWIS